MDSLFPIKFAHLLDWAFQNIVQDPGAFHSKEELILRTKKSVERQQVWAIKVAISGFNAGSLSQLFLPWMLEGESSGKVAHPSRDGGAADAGGKKPKRALKGEEATK